MTRQQHPRRVPPNQQAPLPPYPTQEQAPPPYPHQPQQQEAPVAPQVVQQVHEQQVIIPIQNRFRDAPQHAHCLNCNRDVVTEIHFRAGLLTWIACLGLLLVGCWLGCCLIPFCVDDCQDCEHYCPNCKNIIGKYKRMG